MYISPDEHNLISTGSLNDPIYSNKSCSLLYGFQDNLECSLSFLTSYPLAGEGFCHDCPTNHLYLSQLENNICATH